MGRSFDGLEKIIKKTNERKRGSGAVVLFRGNGRARPLFEGAWERIDMFHFLDPTVEAPKATNFRTDGSTPSYELRENIPDVLSKPTFEDKSRPMAPIISPPITPETRLISKAARNHLRRCGPSH